MNSETIDTRQVEEIAERLDAIQNRLPIPRVREIALQAYAAAKASPDKSVKGYLDEMKSVWRNGPQSTLIADS